MKINRPFVTILQTRLAALTYLFLSMIMGSAYAAPITYGSTIKLAFPSLANSGLHSHKINYWHTGTSGQQQVTGKAIGDSGDNWVVVGSFAQGNSYEVGQQIPSGAVVRFLFTPTTGRLHNHEKTTYPSPDANLTEATVLNDSVGGGNTGDDWVITTADGGPWTEDSSITIRPSTKLNNLYLIAEAQTFNVRQKMGGTDNQQIVGLGTNSASWKASIVTPAGENKVATPIPGIVAAPSTVDSASSTTPVPIPAGILWGVNKDRSNNVFYRSLPDGAWDKPNDGGTATQISVGQNGAVWCVNTAIALPSNNVFYRTGITPSNPLGSGWGGGNGWLSNLAVGPNGQVWGVNNSKANNIFCRTGITSATPEGTGWQQPSDGGTLTQVAMASDGVVWGVNTAIAKTANNIFYRKGITESNPVGTSWVGVNGWLTNIAVGQQGQLWGIGDNSTIFFAPKPAAPDKAAWVAVPGVLAQISVDQNGNVWGVQNSNNIYFRTGITSSNLMGTGWQKIDGLLSWISAGFAIQDGLPSAASAPAPVAAAPAVDTAQTADAAMPQPTRPWGSDRGRFGDMFRRGGQWNNPGDNQNMTQAQLDKITVPVNFEIEAGVTENIAIGSLNSAIEAWCITLDAQQIARYDTNSTANNPWVAMDAKDASGNLLARPLKMISVSSDGIMGLLDNNGASWQYDWTKKIFNKMIMGQAASLECIAVGNADSIWGVDSTNRIVRYNTSSGWQVVPNARGIFVAAGSDDTVMVIDATGSVFNYNGVDTWNRMPVTLDRVAIGNSINIWGINDGMVYQYISGTWKQIINASGTPATGFAEVAVDNAGNVFLVDNVHNIYENLAAVAAAPAQVVPATPAAGTPATATTTTTTATTDAADAATTPALGKKAAKKKAAKKKAQKAAGKKVAGSRVGAKKAGKLKVAQGAGNAQTNPNKKALKRPNKKGRKNAVAADATATTADATTADATTADATTSNAALTKKAARKAARKAALAAPAADDAVADTTVADATTTSDAALTKKAARKAARKAAVVAPAADDAAAAPVAAAEA